MKKICFLVLLFILLFGNTINAMEIDNKADFLTNVADSIIKMVTHGNYDNYPDYYSGLYIDNNKLVFMISNQECSDECSIVIDEVITKYGKIVDIKYVKYSYNELINMNRLINSTSDGKSTCFTNINKINQSLVAGRY